MKTIIIKLPGEKPKHIDLIVELDIMIERLAHISYMEKMKANTKDGK